MSIIVPVYNITSMKHIFFSAINSVIKQTYSAFELLLINDGSTDDTQIVVEQIRDERIRLINKQNGGVESARRIGLEMATGKYIFHMDQDDILEKEAIEKMVAVAKKENADVVVGNHMRFIGNPSFFKWGKIFSESLNLLHRDFMDNYYIRFFGGTNDFPVNIWNKLYRKEFIDAVPVPPTTGFYNEDLNYNLHILPMAERIVCLTDITYYYRWGGFTSRKIENMEEVALSCYRIKMEQIKKLDLWSFEIYVCYELLSYFNSVLYQEIEYENPSLIQFRQICERLFSYSETQHAISVIKKSKFRNEHIAYMLEEDYDSLEAYERKMCKRNKAKNRVKKLLNKI